MANIETIQIVMDSNGLPKDCLIKLYGEVQTQEFADCFVNGEFITTFEEPTTVTVTVPGD